MRFSSWFVAVAACSGGVKQIPLDPPPPRMTQGVLSGPLCAGDHCKCRELTAAADGGAGVPQDKTKRFEVRLNSAQALWATVGHTVLYKSPEQAEACFYLDLAPGETPVKLRGSDPNGVSAAWTIHELGTKTKSWYDTFALNCGSPGVCSLDNLDEFRRELDSKPHHVMDMCGSVKIKSVGWATTKGPDQMHPGELAIELVLDIYKRVPTLERGSALCGKEGPRAKKGDPGDDAVDPPAPEPGTP